MDHVAPQVSRLDFEVLVAFDSVNGGPLNSDHTVAECIVLQPSTRHALDFSGDDVPVEKDDDIGLLGLH